jgi:hypothetical protein
MAPPHGYSDPERSSNRFGLGLDSDLDLDLGVSQHAEPFLKTNSLPSDEFKNYQRRLDHHG